MNAIFVPVNEEMSERAGFDAGMLDGFFEDGRAKADEWNGEEREESFHPRREDG